MPMFDVYAERKTAEIMADTWGHLAPEPRREYTGTIVFTHGAYGHIVPIKADFAELPDSPWFFEAMNDFIAEQKVDAGEVYRFAGSYMRLKNGAHRFRGKVRKLNV